MLSMIASMLYRLVKTRMTWVFLGFYTLTIIVGSAALKAVGADAALQAKMAETSSEVTLGLSVMTSAAGADILQACGLLFVRGSVISMFAAAFCASFVVSDLRTGFIKNLMQVRGGRLVYAVSAAVVTACVCAAYVVTGVAISLISLTAAGFSMAPLDVRQFIPWCAEVAATSYAYALIAVLVALLTRSAVASVLSGLMLGGAAVENLLYTALGLVTGHPEEVRQVFDGYLAVTISQLGLGSVQSWEALVPVAVTVAVAIVVSAGIMRRRRLA